MEIQDSQFRHFRFPVHELESDLTLFTLSGLEKTICMVCWICVNYPLFTFLYRIGDWSSGHQLVGSCTGLPVTALRTLEPYRRRLSAGQRDASDVGCPRSRQYAATGTGWGPVRLFRWPLPSLERVRDRSSAVLQLCLGRVPVAPCLDGSFRSCKPAR